MFALVGIYGPACRSERGAGGPPDSDAESGSATTAAEDATTYVSVSTGQATTAPETNTGGIDPAVLRGEGIFLANCAEASCHGRDGNSGEGPELSWRVGLRTDAELSSVIRNGIETTSGRDPPTVLMPAHSFSDDELADLLAHLRHAFPPPQCHCSDFFGSSCGGRWSQCADANTYTYECGSLDPDGMRTCTCEVNGRETMRTEVADACQNACSEGVQHCGFPM